MKDQTEQNSVLSHATDVFSGGGEMGALVRSHDWSQTDLGPIDRWPQSLKTSLSLILNSQHPMWIGWGAQRTFLYNDAYIQILGASKHPWALGRPFAEVWAEIWDVCAPLADRVFNQGEATFQDAIRLFMKKKRDNDGAFYLQEGYYSFSYSPIRDESGNVGGLFCPSADVTSKVLSERRLRTLAELSAKTLLQKTIELACTSIADILGKNSDDIPFSLLYLIDPQTQSAHLVETTGIRKEDAGQWPTEDVLKTGNSAVISVKNRMSLPTGLAEQKISEAVLIPLVSPGQQQASGLLILGVSPARSIDSDYQTFHNLIASNVASALKNAKTAEDERKHLEAMAEIDRAKTAFFSNVSHEFRTPLTLMLGPLEDNLVDSQSVPAIYRERESLAYRNAVRLLKLVNSLLDFSRIEAGRVNANYRPTDLAKATADLASTFRSAIEKAGLKFHVHTNAIEGKVYVDREMWEKIVLNLLSNAFKFTLHGEIAVRIADLDGKVLLSVRDSGIGISESELPRLFERFHRVEGAQGRTHEGTGIGLALVQELVKIHGGTISVESKLGEGTQFSVEIPKNKSHLPESQVSEETNLARSTALGASFIEEALRWLPDKTPEKAAQAVKKNAQRSKILLADDNADMRKYVNDLLSTHWDIEAVSDGETALAKAVSNPPDLILSDVMMPKMDGFQLIGNLKKNAKTKNVPVVLLSARSGEESRTEGLYAGADDYLVKPFSAKELIARIQTHLQIGKLKAQTERERLKLSEIFTQAPVGIAVVEGPDHIYTSINPAYYSTLFGGERNFIGKAVREAVPESVEQGFIKILDHVYRTGEPFVGEEVPLRLSQLDGEPKDFYVSYVYQPLRDSEGKTLGLVAIVQDVSEQVLARKKIEIAIASRDEFLSVASHELKTPITSLKLQLQMTKRRIKPELGQMPTPAILAAVIENSEKQVDRLTKLVEDLLDVSRIQAGKLIFNFEEMDVGELIREVMDRFSDQLEQAKCGVQIDADPDLIARWDRSRIEQVIVNLISNVVKYAPGKPFRVSVKSDAKNAIMRVDDSGPGISKERLDKIFNRFERATSSRNISGLGLGLYIVRQIVNGHQGNIRVESEVEVGTSFVVELPLLLNPISS